MEIISEPQHLLEMHLVIQPQHIVTDMGIQRVHQGQVMIVLEIQIQHILILMDVQLALQQLLPTVLVIQQLPIETEMDRRQGVRHPQLIVSEREEQNREVTIPTLLFGRGNRINLYNLYKSPRKSDFYLYEKISKSFPQLNCRKTFLYIEDSIRSLSFKTMKL